MFEVENKNNKTLHPSRAMRRLREVLGGASLGIQEKLELLVKIIASEFSSNVCSIYVKTAENVLVLFATEGLNPLAVHFTHLHFGEGVVGDIAENQPPMVLSDVRSHPNFAYRKETGEDDFTSLLGVPIVRSGKVLGVLTIQSDRKRLYTNDEVDLLQTMAMVVAELLNSREFSHGEQVGKDAATSWMTAELSGISLNPGVASGVAMFHQAFPHYSRKTVANIHKEKRRLQRALSRMQLSLKNLFDRQDLDGDEAHKDVFEVYRMLAFDRGWKSKINAQIQQGLSSEAAIEKVLADMKSTVAGNDDAFKNARIADFEDLSSRLLQILTGKDGAKTTSSDDKFILVARSMGPSELLDYEPGSVAALVLEEGQRTGHVAVVARAMDIPVVAKVSGALLNLEPGDPVLVDGDTGKVFVRPGGTLTLEYEYKKKARKDSLSRIKSVIGKPCVTKDEKRIFLSINAGLPMDIERIDKNGADGVGLYRTEIPFMMESSLPDLETQTDLYKEVLAMAKGKPVSFRTLDIGGDKVLPYLDMPSTENPAMGWRAARISLDRPALFRTQIRALIQAADGVDLYIKIPMITTTEEFKRVRKIIDLEAMRARQQETSQPTSIKVGAMLEVPAITFELKTLLDEVDFLSIGTNDLLQFFFAADRGNPMLTNMYDPLSPSFLRFLQAVLKECQQANIPINVCGELASSPLEAMVLLGLGFQSLSVSPSTIGRIKLMAKDLDTQNFGLYIDRLLTRSTKNIRHACQSYARDHGIYI